MSRPCIVGCPCQCHNGFPRHRGKPCPGKKKRANANRALYVDKFDWKEEDQRKRELRKEIRERDGNRCRYCGVDVVVVEGTSTSQPPNARTIDHIVPRARGGKTTLYNCVVACRRCNARKGDKTLEEAEMPLLALEAAE